MSMIKKGLRGIRSMKFGILLLVLIVAVSLIGSVITQGESEEFYLANYSQAYLILALGLDHVYYTPYFLGLGALLILNLTLCSLVRFGSALRAGAAHVKAAGKMVSGTPVSGRQREKLLSFLEKGRYRRQENGGVTVFYKNGIGHMGSFLVHLSLVLILVLGAVVLYTGESEVYGVNYGAPLTLADGTVVSLVDFTMRDEQGNVHYESTLTITTPEARQITESASVNYPINFDGKKYFQNSYGFSARVVIHNTANGAEEEVYLTEPVFLKTSESGAGVYYMAACTDYVEGPDGQLMMRSEQIEEGKPAAFLLSVLDGKAEGMGAVLVEQGTPVAVEDVIFTFEELRPYPGIRIKATSRALMAFLYASFGLMIAGLWFCFFPQPVYITVGSGFYRISGLRNPEGLETQMQLWMKEE